MAFLREQKFQESATALKNLQTETLINGWISNEEAESARRAARLGYLRDLQAIKAERTEWQSTGNHYLTMMSWDLVSTRHKNN